MNENNSYKIATVLLSGYGDNDHSIIGLETMLAITHKMHLGNKSAGVYRFPFNYAVNDTWWNKFSRFDEVRNRFTRFLTDKGLLNGDIMIDLVGYSQGGMIALYSAGRNKIIRDRIRKYVSIASPHGGAQMLNALAYIPVVRAIALPFLHRKVTAQLTANNPTFLTSSYPNSAKKVFEEIPAGNMLQIWSPHDHVATSESSTRFVSGMHFYDIAFNGRNFKNKMQSCEFNNIRLHTEIPKKSEVIRKVIDFFYGDLIRKAKKLSLLPIIEINKESGFPGETIHITSPDYGKYDRNNDYSYSVKFDNKSIDSKLEKGALSFVIPNTSPGEKNILTEFGNLPNRQNLQSNPVTLIIPPYITDCSSYRVIPNEKVFLRGVFPPNQDLLVYLDDISLEFAFSEDELELTIPENMDDGKKEIKVQYDGKFSNTIEIIICNRIGNLRTRELHLLDCPLLDQMNKINRLPLSVSHDQPKDNGLDACHWCHIRNPDEMGSSKTNLVYLGRQLKCPHCNKLIDLETKR